MRRLAAAWRNLSLRGRVLLAALLVVVVAGAGAFGYLALRGDVGQAARVESLRTGSGTLVGDGDLVPAATPLHLAFSAAMDPSSVHLRVNDAPLGLHWADGGTSAELDVASLHLGRVVLAVDAGARDGEGNELAPWDLTFSLIFSAATHTVALPAPALIQIPNDPSARDQVGLQSAAMVYEYLTEGGITRFTAIYTHVPDTIGPVRSGRSIAFDLTRHYGGVLLASGISAGAAAVLAANPVPHVFDSGGGVFYRMAGRPAPNNLFTSGDAVQRAVVGASLPHADLPAASVPIHSGQPATTVSVPQHGTTYSFDPSTRTYLKQVGGRTLTDAATGQPLHIQLLIVLHTTATPTPYIADPNGARGLDFDLTSGGAADLYFDGVEAAGHWSSPGPHSPLRFTLDDGAVVTPPPLTWVDVVSS